ncbi:4'-phosphopantetheinyl transferase superfamily protein [Gemmobacter sp. 24YEA27]|uniref:4'-phosphopantetheinyl transferase family protein n=1 Tax=Gemmobacter sp. 24YEA27 TaxID=3040672 RepID=UPI0024B34A46|nr:4'-phosphopantetheinyl transferase superfamily protein [Gemmobacter sp. 24YEA27]
MDRGTRGLRRVLANRLAARPEDLRFRIGPCGRPSLGGSLRFSLSHAGGWAAVALCEGVDPGLDIEAISPVSVALAEHHFAPEECAALEALPPKDWQAAFFRCWTRKEAVVKATGRGLSMPLIDFAVNLSPLAPRLLRIRDDDARTWALWQLPTGPGMAGSLAMRNQGRRVNLRFCSGWLGLHHDANLSAQENTRGSGWGPGPDGCRSHG